MEPLLSVRDLSVTFRSNRKTVNAVKNLSFDVGKGEIVAIVGESGSGKSNAVLALLDLVRAPGEVESGEILFDGQDLTQLSPRQMRKIRGNRIAMIFQDPMTALNPLLSVGRQLSDLARDHLGLGKAAAYQRGVETLAKVGIAAPERRMASYPHQLSGGIRQRVMIAMALICEPDLLIADEPTTALDVTIQAQIIELIKGLQREYNMSIIWITHDLGVVASLADRVIVMYSGTQIESASANTIFNGTVHPYTEALLASMPRVDVPPVEELVTLPPPLDKDPLSTGCLFVSQCRYAIDRCREVEPMLDEVVPGHFARCWRIDRDE